MMKRRTIAQSAAIWKITPDMLRSQYAALLPGKREMLAKALATGRMVNGYTANQLKESLDRYEAMSKAPDDDYILRTGDKY